MARTMNIYACGGAACNIGANFMRYIAKQQTGFCDINIYFIDSSKSNLSPNIPKERIYLVNGLDGGGKLRSSVYDPLKDCSKDILHQFQPADINIVLNSAGGGTGSTIGPILVSDLLSKNKDVITVVVGSTGSRIEVDNTIKTLKSLDNISKHRTAPVIAAYREISPEKSIGKVDEEIETLIMTLAAIFSGNNRGLDTADLHNFLNYNKVTSFQPKLTCLDLISGDIILSKGHAVISLVTMTDDKTPWDSNVLVGYQAVGIMPDNTRDSINSVMPIHCCTITGYFNGVMDRLGAKLAQYDELRNTVIEKPIANLGEATTDDGMCL